MAGEALRFSAAMDAWRDAGGRVPIMGAHQVALWLTLDAYACGEINAREAGHELRQRVDRDADYGLLTVGNVVTVRGDLSASLRYAVDQRRARQQGAA